MNLFDIIERIRPRPGMYLGEPGITKLCSFLDGYSMALYDLNANKVTDDALFPMPFHCFHDYVALRLNYYESTSGWRNMILDQVAHDEEKGLALFFTLLDDFKTLTSTRFVAANLTDEHIAYHYDSKRAPRVYTAPDYDRAQPLYPNPVRIYYVELMDQTTCKCYVGVVQTRDKHIFSRTLYKRENDILSFYESCFGAVAWQPIDQNPFKE